MAVTAYTEPAAVDNSSNWTNPNNLLARDGSFGWPNGPESSWEGDQYGFAIPAGATIDGIEVRIYGIGNFAAENITVQLIKASTPTGDTKVTGDFGTGGLENQTVGGAADLWGTSWSQSDINNAGFGVRLDTPEGPTGFDVVEVRIYYTEGTDTNDEKDAEVHGADTANSERAAEVDGIAAPSLTVTQNDTEMDLEWTYTPYS